MIRPQSNSMKNLFQHRYHLFDNYNKNEFCIIDVHYISHPYKSIFRAQKKKESRANLEELLTRYTQEYQEDL